MTGSLPWHAIRASGAEGGTAGDLRFPWWSFSKTLLAICALALAEEGALDLDAPLDLPSPAPMPIPMSMPTPRQLIAQTSGLPDYASLPAYRADVAAGRDAWPADLLLSRALAQPRLFAPGTGWAYSNVASLLLRLLLERIAGDIGAQVDARIARPLGIDIRLARSRADMAALWPAGADYDPGWVYHGCFTGTARAAARVLDGLACGALLPAPALAWMRQVTPLGGALPGRPWTEHGYGGGLMAGGLGWLGSSFGHTGGGPFAGCTVTHLPDLADPVTLAVFAPGPDGADRAEREMARLAACFEACR